MKTLYAVMIQNEEYVEPEMCLEFTGTNAATYKSKEDALQFIAWMVEEGYPREDYFLVEINKLEE